jgi:hypothetical protein
MLGGKVGKWIGYVVGAVLVLCLMHVVAHILAWVSMWKYAGYLISLQLGIMLSLIAMSKDKYVCIEHLFNITGLFVWLYMNSIACTYWQYYKFMWCVFAMNILRQITVRNNRILL